jgi:excisionase family DNA binding protein
MHIQDIPVRAAAASRAAAPNPAPDLGQGAQLYRVPDAMRLLRLSRSVIYEQLRSGRLRSVRQGRSRLIPATAIAEYVALLESEAGR